MQLDAKDHRKPGRSYSYTRKTGVNEKKEAPRVGLEPTT